MQFGRLSLLYLGAVAAAGLAGAQSQYSLDGTPTGLEEEIRWRVNRGRFDTASENLTRGTAYTDVPASTGPLAPNQSITLAARHQSEDLAKANLFQHTTVPNSLYYNPVTQPYPWDRMQAEGYSWSAAGENIAAGYMGAEDVYVAWWNSTGHRENMYNNALREIGNGYYYWSASTYQTYFTMDLGSSGNNTFFTDTLFNDANGNGIYDDGEGITGVAVRLLVGTAPVSWYDVSSSVGSFAVPLQSVTTGTTVQVVLSNTTAAGISLSIPKDYRTYSTISLAAGESRVYGTFVVPATTRNVGFRDVVALAVPAPLVPPKLAISAAGSNILLSWTSTTGLQYQPQSTTDSLAWNSLMNGFLPGTGSNMSCLDLGAPGQGRKFYRLLVTKP